MRLLRPRLDRLRGNPEDAKTCAETQDSLIVQLEHFNQQSFKL